MNGGMSMKILQLIATSDYMELLLSDGRAVRVPGTLADGGFAGRMNANWFLVSGLTYYYKPVEIQDVMGRVTEDEKADIVRAVADCLAESESGASVIFK